MARMKKSLKPKVASAGEDTGGSQGAGTAALEGRRPIAVKDNTKKNHLSMPPPSKSGAMDKKERKADMTTSSTLEGPSKSSREKEASQRKKTTAVLESGSSSSGISAPLEKAASDGEGDSDFQDDKVVAHALRKPQRKREEKTEREFTEYECLKQLAALKTADKRPPPAMSADTFAFRFGLHNEGINSHRVKIGKSITLEEVEHVFEKEKSRNGFLLAEKLSTEMRKDAEKLYCLCYQRNHVPAHVAKEFAIGFVLDKVQHKGVNWAEFASKTNLAQRRSYCRRLKVWIQGLASLRNVPIIDVYNSEGFSDYIDTEFDKLRMVNVHGFLGSEGATGQVGTTPPSFQALSALDTAFL